PSDIAMPDFVFCEEQEIENGGQEQSSSEISLMCEKSSCSRQGQKKDGAIDQQTFPRAHQFARQPNNQWRPEIVETLLNSPQRVTRFENGAEANKVIPEENNQPGSHPRGKYSRDLQEGLKPHDPRRRVS